MVRTSIWSNALPCAHGPTGIAGPVHEPADSQPPFLRTFPQLDCRYMGEHNVRRMHAAARCASEIAACPLP
jgi:hypothetical protein